MFLPKKQSHMIRYLKNKDIDYKEYDDCVLNAIQSKVYAFSWYLDAVTETWDVLVLDDYEAVMPLPKRKKYNINYIFQSSWIQHLGIFSRRHLTDNQSAIFIKKIPRKIVLIDYNTNFKTPNSQEQTNYILPLERDYKTIFKTFSKGRKSSINQAKKCGLEIREIEDWASIITLFKQNKGLNVALSNDAYKVLEILLKKIQRLNNLKILVAYSKSNELLGGAFFIVSNLRITYLFSAVNQKGRDLQAMSLILNTVIKNYSKSDYVFDFEGSMLLGVAKFIRSFGAQKEFYYHFKKWRLF